MRRTTTKVRNKDARQLGACRFAAVAAVSACSLVFPLAAEALGLGRSVSTAIVGRPLEMSVTLNLDPGADATKLCPLVEVFYGDTRLPDAAVRTQITRSAGGLYALKVRAERPVNEPVVTVFARAGCDATTVSRRYVMLAEAITPEAEVVEAPSGAVAAASRRTQPPLDLSETFSGNATAPLASAGPLNRSSSTAPVRREISADELAARQARRERRAASRAVSKSKPAEPANRSPRVRDALQVAPWDLSEGSASGLRSETILRSEPIADEKQRAAFAALWQVMRASPEEVARSAQRLDQLETTVKAIQVDSAKQRTEVGALGQELQTARKQRNWLAIAAAAGFGLLALVAGFLLLARGRATAGASAPWWERSAQAPLAPSGSAQKTRSILKRRRNKAHQDDDEEDRPVRTSSISSGHVPLSAARSGKASLDDLDSHFDTAMMPRGEPVTNLSDSQAADLGLASGPVTPSAPLLRASEFSKRHMPGGAEPMAFTDSVPAGSIGSTEELLDIQQQADFFASLGQHNRALELLRDHLDASTETSPLVQLDLIDLLHRLGRKEEFDAERERFNASFRTQVPAFDAYPPQSEGLAAYEAAMSRIESLWPSPKVLTVIDESILRRTDTGDDVFDLQAYRELMLLYAVAKDLNDEAQALGAELDRSLGGGSDHPNTTLQPLPSSVARENPAFLEPSRAAGSVTLASDVSRAEIERLMQPTPTGRLGVDIDLGDIFDGEEAPESRAPVDMLAADAEPSAEFMPSAVAPQGALGVSAPSIDDGAAPDASTNAAPLPPPRPSFLKPVTSRVPRAADDNSVEFDWPDSKTKHDVKRERFQNSKI